MLPPLQNTFNAIQGPTTNPHSLADLKKWMSDERHLAIHQPADALDLIFRNWNRFFAIPNEIEDAVTLSHRYPGIGRRNYVHERIAREQRQGDLHATIAPLADLGHQWQEGAYALLFKLGHHFFLVAWPELQRVPLRRWRRRS